MTIDTIPVTFRSTTLTLIDHSGEPYVAMRPVVEGMGLDWSTQGRKLRSNSARWGVVIMTTPSGSGEQQANCIPLRKLPGWLSTVSPNRVRADLRETILAYQRECDDVLWRHWNERRLPPGAAPSATGPIVSPEFMDAGHRMRAWAKATAIGSKSVPAVPAELLDGVVADMLFSQRWLVSFDGRLNMVLTQVPNGALVIRPDELPQLMADTGSVFRADMPAIIDAAVKRLAGIAADRKR